VYASRARLRRLPGAIALTLALCAGAAAVVPAGAAADYATGFALGTSAYEYGVPLLDTERIFRSGTSATVCNPVTGHGPLNRFCSIRRLATAAERTVNAPNNDTLYTVAFLDLSRQPQVLHAPAIRHRFWEFELVDPWTNNFFNMTSATQRMGRGDFGVTGGGDWAVAGPGFHDRVPRGVQLVRSRYDRVWVIGRTYVRGRTDLAAVHRIQDRYAITPLSRFATAYTPPRPKRIDRIGIDATIPGTQPGEDPLAFYAALGREMVQFPAPADDRPELARLRTIGVGPGLDPAHDRNLSADTLRGMRDAVTKGHATVLSAVLALYVKEFSAHDGYLIGDLGDWGTDYELRAIGDALGVGGQRASIATYPLALLDNTLASLTGSTRYVIHIPARDLPIPARAFWSLTLYDTNSYFVPNPLNRYVINNLTHLHRNPDGSIDLYVQHDRPSQPQQVANWLPAPAPGIGFRLIWRLYDLGPAVFGVLDGKGWQPPPVQRCDATGHAADGTACAA
jgi:hypothetical protein